MTKLIVKAGEGVNIKVHDHLIVGRQGHASFKTLRLI
jgi:DNA repair protein RadC